MIAMAAGPAEETLAPAAQVEWKTVELRSTQFHRSLAVAIIRDGDTMVHNMFVELGPCHDHIYITDCYRWLDIHGAHRIRGCDRVLQLGERIFLGVPLRWIPGQKFKENPTTSSLAGRVDIGGRHTLVNIPWLTAYLLLVSVEGKAIRDRDPARRAGELLQLLTSLPSSGLEAPCAGGSMVISTDGVSEIGRASCRERV